MSVTKRRLNDGGRAAAISTENLEQLSYDELLRLRDIAADGAVAMQSLDDLGSEQANQEAWDTLMLIEKKLTALDAEIGRRRKYVDPYAGEPNPDDYGPGAFSRRVT
jgi:hypothetical protein